MFDEKLVIEILHQLLNATNTIRLRFEPIKNSDDFLSTDMGLEKLDAICMQLIAIGESLKNIDKITNRQLLSNYPEIDWKGAMAMRDIITHHYFDIDSEIVFDVCHNKLLPLAETIETILKDLIK
jgi:uncharacterized protein with HEPN domain